MTEWNPVDLLIKGGKVVSSRSTTEEWIAVDKGRVVALGNTESCPPAKRVIDASGKYVIPGIVDPEIHPSVPPPGTYTSDQPNREVMFKDTRALLASGITSAAMQIPAVVWNAGLKDFEKIKWEREEIPSLMEAFPGYMELMADSWVDHWLTPVLVNDAQAKEIPEFAREHGVTSYKFYHHCSPGEHIWSMWPIMPRLGFYYYDDGTVYIAMRNIASLGYPGVLQMHLENWEIGRVRKEELMAKEGRSQTDPSFWNEKTPAFCEAGRIRDYAYYAKETHCPLYVQHVTCPESCEEVIRARAEGAVIYGQSGVQYLTLDRGTWTVNVPLRPQDTFPSMWEALSKGRGIDVLGSDHVCWGRTLAEIEKTGLEYKKDIWTVYEGFMGRGEGMLPVLLSEGVNKGRISLERLVQVCCEETARIFGLYPKKGAIRVGSDADLVVVDLDKTKTLTRDQVLNYLGWSIYEGWEIKGWPVMTILRGEIKAEWPEGETKTKILGKPNGSYLPRKPEGSPYPPMKFD